MANQKIVVDPITRIEGHLRMQAVMDDNNVIVDAMSTGTMWRGLEVILKGRDPRDAWAFVERICGVCTGIHALSAVRAVEDALQGRGPLLRQGPGPARLHGLPPALPRPRPGGALPGGHHPGPAGGRPGV